MTEPEIMRLIVAMATALPREWSFLTKPQQQATAATYCRMLGDIPYAVGRAAVEGLIATSSRMPTIADVRAAALELLHGATTAGGEAWEAVRKAIQACGRVRTPGVDFTWRDPVTARCVEAMGWAELCASELQAADRKQFIDLYDRLAREHRREQNTSQLPATRDLLALASGEVKNATRAALSAPAPQIAARGLLGPAAFPFHQLIEGETP
jgi:hypothetical protein